MTELPIDGAAALASASDDATVTAAIEAVEDAADITSAQEALAEWDADDRRTYRISTLSFAGTDEGGRLPSRSG